MSQQLCPIWQTPATVIDSPSGKDVYDVNSPRAGGRYEISGTGFCVIDGKLEENQKALLTSWLIQERIADREPTIKSHTISSYPNTPSRLSTLCPLSPDERADNLLKYIKQHTPNIGDHFEFAINLNPDLQDPWWIRYAEMLAWSESLKSGELDYLLGFLESQGWIKRYNGTRTAPYCCSITHKGDDHLSNLTRITVSQPIGFRV
ncbi:MAG: hypothetical protein OXI24_13410 [Candidatus Poribacteria bacterium]|nr:hypothetical protein [Candidatus Poribacteria bacterium]